jgi:siderophore synthetase component
MTTTYKEWVIHELKEWALTFIDERDDEGEATSESYDLIMKLVNNFEQNVCSSEDYENILFHLWQIELGKN